MENIQTKIPKEVTHVTLTLEKAGFEAYLVGGCVRDLLLERTPKDWDVTTNAKPEEIQELFEHTFYENPFGTVGIVSDETLDETLKTIEVTPYRLESAYSDERHPDTVIFSDKLEDDLKRRDFTINAIAYNVSSETLVDLYNGQKDLKDKIIKTVGNSEDRFNEDTLRILRAVRFATELDFSIEIETQKSIIKFSNNLENISQERIRDEFTKIIMSKNPMDGVILSQKLGLLKYIMPELEMGMDEKQKGAHIYTIWEHNLRTLQHSADKEMPLHLRLSALLHDIAKPHTKRWHKEKKEWTFYGHDVVGERVSREILKRLKFSGKIIDVVPKLVRNHLFFSDIDQITLSAVRRIIANVGPENVWDLMKLRTCDRIGMGVPKEKPYRLRKYMAMIEEAMKDPVSVKMLKINGNRIMEIINEKPGPKIGLVLNALMEEVLDNPKLNTEEYLETKTLELIKLSEKELIQLSQKGIEKKTAQEEKELKEIRDKHHVK
ncbi:MAG: HD domain-containing protein [Candidatus Pacebacteria bacterium]|nr:HD domain-containing protein [Candidatus Paceibacterota bacterium]